MTDSSMGQTPDSYDAQIKSLGEQYSRFIEQRALDCSRFKALGTIGSDDITCNAAKMHIADINNTFNIMTNDIENDIKALNKKISYTNKEINELEKKNILLTNTLDKAINLDAGSQGMITDVQYLYNQELVSNWIIAFSIIGFISLTYYSRNISFTQQTQAIREQIVRNVPRITSMIPGM